MLIKWFRDLDDEYSCIICFRDGNIYLPGGKMVFLTWESRASAPTKTGSVGPSAVKNPS